MPTLVEEIQQKVQFKTDELREFCEKHKSDEKDEHNQPKFNMPKSVFVEFQAKNKELDDLNDELNAAIVQESWKKNELRAQELKGIVREIPHSSGGSGSEGRQVKTHDPRDMSGQKLGDIVVKSREYLYKGSGKPKFSVDIRDVDVKTLITTSAGYAPANNRGNMVVDFATRPLTVADLIPSDPTSESLIKWMEQTTRTIAADTVSEGGEKQQSTFVWIERNSPVVKIAHWVAVTEEQVDDVPGFQGLINRDLINGLREVEEDQILTGNGTPPDMDGFLHKTGVQTTAKGAGEDAQDAIYRAFTLVRYTGRAEPSATVMHPNDWEPIRLLRTTDGVYIFGNPSEGDVERLWGKPVIVTTAITENTSLVGAFSSYAHISRKMGIRVDVSDSHEDFFILNQLAVRAEMRESLEIRRPAAFCKVTSV